MNEQYQKVAYIGLRRKDGSYAVNIPLYVKLDEVDKKEMNESREEIIHEFQAAAADGNEVVFSFNRFPLV